MNIQAFPKIQLKNGTYHQYLHTKNHNDYNIYVKYRGQVKRETQRLFSSMQ